MTALAKLDSLIKKGLRLNCVRYAVDGNAKLDSLIKKGLRLGGLLDLLAVLAKLDSLIKKGLRHAPDLVVALDDEPNWTP